MYAWEHNALWITFACRSSCTCQALCREISHHVSGMEDPVRTFLLERTQTALTRSGIFSNLITPCSWNTVSDIFDRNGLSPIGRSFSNIFSSGKSKVDPYCFIYVVYTYHVTPQIYKSKAALSLWEAIKHSCLCTMHYALCAISSDCCYQKEEGRICNSVCSKKKKKTSRLTG